MIIEQEKNMKNKKEENTLFVNGHVNYTKVITRENGEMVKLVARPYGFMITPEETEIGVDVYKNVDGDWILCRTTPTLNGDQTWISREHYLSVQRKEQVSEAMLLATIGQYIKIIQEFKKLIFAPKNLMIEIKDEFNTHQFENIKFNYQNLTK